MPSSYTTSLRLTLPATGELSGQWGNTVNTGITELLDAAVAGTASISTWGGAGVAYTLSNNSGTADEARKMFIVATGSPGEAKNVICPAVSKFYVFRNDTTGGYALTLKTSGGTGIAVPAGQYKFLYCDGTNVVEMFNSAGALTLSGALSVGGTTTLASNPTLSAGTANGVLYLNGSKVATSGSALTFDGSNLGVNTASPNSINGTSTARYFGVQGDGSANSSDGRIVLSNPRAYATIVPNNTTAGRIYFQLLNASGGTTTDAAYITALASGSGGASGYGIDLGFYPKADNGTSSIAMRLDSAGNLGLQATPSAWSTTTSVFENPSGSIYTFSGNNQIGINSNAYYNGTNWIYRNASSVPAADYFLQNGQFVWRNAVAGTSGNIISFSEQMRLTSTGLGIGTSSPGARLHSLATTNPAIFASSDATALFTTYQYNTSTVCGYIGNGAGVVTGAGASNFGVRAENSLVFAAGGNNERMRLDSSGNLGIGTSSPVAKLDVRTTSDGNVGYFRRVGGTINPGITVFANETGNTVGFDTVYSTSSPSYKFRVNGSDVMTLDAAGNLGLGVTPSAWSGLTALQVSGTAALYANNSVTGLSFNQYFNGTNNIYLRNDFSNRLQMDSGAFKFFTAPSGTAGNAITFTQAMTLDASGRLGIGLTNPAYRLDVEISAGPYSARFNNSNSSTNQYNVVLFGQAAAGSAIGYIGTGGSAVGNGAFANNFVVGTQTSNALVFNTADAERARISSTGSFSVNAATSVSTGTNTLQDSGSSPQTLRLYNSTDSNNATNRFLICDAAASVLRAEIRSNGGLANYQANDVNLSDRREKTNFAPAKDYLDTICAIPVQTFNYIDQSEDDPGLTLGVVAQDVQAVAPELVMESNWGTEDNPKMRLSIYQTDLQYALMKCIQEQQALITALTARVAALEKP